MLSNLSKVSLAEIQDRSMGGCAASIYIYFKHDVMQDCTVHL